MAALAVSAVACRSRMPPAPAQPVAFSHRQHAGTYRIGCPMCHAYAEHSPIAGVPSAARCAGCHRFVSKDKPEVKKVNEAFQKGTPIQWARVTRVPDHVYFTHERHVAAGVRCQECHGAVEEMDVVRQVAPLTMGWCLDCHNARHASND